MPNPQITFPASFVTANALAFANTDKSAQLVSAAAPLPVSLSGLDGAGFAISNFPATQAVSGSVSVGNFPATQAVSGSVSVGNFPATQAVSVAALPLPAGAATAAGQVSAQASLTAIAASLPGALGAMPGGASTSVVVASDLANLEPGGAAITGQAMPAGGVGLTGWMSAIYKACAAPLVAGTAHIGGVSVDDVADGVATSGSVSSAAVVVSASMAGYAGGSFQITSIGSGNTVTFEHSNDGVNWAALYVQNSALTIAGPVNTANTVGLWTFTTASAYVRARVSVYGSGTVMAALVQKRSVAPVTGVSLGGSGAVIGSVAVTGTVPVTGNVNITTGYIDSTAALGANASFVGAGRAMNSSLGYGSFFNASVYADQAGTLYLEQSVDSSANFYPLASQAVAAGSGAQLSARLTGAVNSTTAYRVRFVNGAAAQSVFRLSSSFTAG